MSFNKIILVGNLGKDPELRYTPQGDAVCSFTMATNERKKDKSGEMQNVATWFRVTLWRHQAENAAKYLAKGRQVYIEGRLRIEEWTDRDNNVRQSLEVTATDMQFLSSGERSGGGEYSNAQHDDDFGSHSGPPVASTSAAAASNESKPNTVSAPANDDDIPF
jgi:single-strand DNA-binding protein